MGELFGEMEQPVNPGGKCSFKRLLHKLDPKDSADLLHVIGDRPDIPLTLIKDVLAKRGHQVSESSLRRHRKGRCGCGIGR